MCINVLVKIIRVTIKADKRMSENNIIVVSFVELKTTFEDVLATLYIRNQVLSRRGCHRERGWNQQIMMLENGRLYHSMYLGIL
jgi:hypothetical protein